MSDNNHESRDKREDEVGARSSEDRIADVYLGNKGGHEQQRRVRERIDWMRSQRAGEYALDIGCSQGILAVLLARDGMTVTGVDVNPHAIETARQLAAKEPAEISDRIEFLVTDACEPDFVSQQFDTVCVGEVVEHLQNPAVMLQSAFEKLREGGVFILTTPHGYLPHDDHYQEFGLQDLLNILPPELSVDTIDTSNGYIYLKATKTAQTAAQPNPETLLAISTKSLIEQQKQFYEVLNYRRDLIEDLRAGEDKGLDRLRDDHAKIKAIAIRRKKELEAAEKEVQKVTRIALRRRRIVDEMTISATAQKQEIESLENDRKALREEMARAKAGVAVQKVELQRKNRIESILRSRIDQRQEEMRAITSSSIYQTGLAFRLAFKKPFPNLFRLPLRLAKAALGRPLAIADPYRGALLASVKARPTVAAQPIADSPNLSVSNLSVSQRVKLFREAGDTEGEYEFIKEEVDQRPTEGVLRALYWSSIKAEKFETAFQAIQRLEEFIGPSPTPDQAKRLDQLRSGPGMNLASLAAIPARAALSYEPVRGRIAYVLHNSLPYSSGGYATRAHGLMTAAKASGLDPVCITRPGYPIDLKPELDPSQIDTEQQIDSIRYLRLLEPSYQSGTGLVKYTQDAAEALIKVFREEKPECVIAASAYRSALPALIAARSLGLPFVYEVRGFWEVTRISREPEYEHTAGFKVIRKIESEVAKGADKVLTLTTPMKDELVSRGVPAEQIILAPNSCDIDKFTPRERDQALAARLNIPEHVLVIGYIGTFVQYEGLEHLTEACALLKERGLEFRLLLVGNENASGTDRGPITEEIMETAEKAGIADWLIMPGRIPHEEVASYYSLIDIAPFPRKPQPVTEMVSPMKPLEAMAMKKAVVVSSVRALEEMVEDGVTGLVFRKGSVESLADAIAILIDSPSLRNELGVAGRNWVAKERTWTKTATIVHDVVHKLTQPEQESAVAKSNALPMVPPLKPEDQEIFAAMQERYAKRDAKLGARLFSPDDWKRTEIALTLSAAAERIGDIGIGQGQLVNCLSAREQTKAVYGIDFRRHSKLLEPNDNTKFSFVEWDITQSLQADIPILDLIIAMEVFEHIEHDQLDAAIQRVVNLARDRAMFFTVPYMEKEPLYHHDKPGGHKQSFDDARIEEVFGPQVIWTHYREKWFLGYTAETIKTSGALPFDTFLAIATDDIDRRCHAQEMAD